MKILNILKSVIPPTELLLELQYPIKDGNMRKTGNGLNEQYL